MEIKKSILIAIGITLLVSVVGNIYLIYAISKMETALKDREIDSRVLAFRNMFTENVLLGEKEIDFDTRLALETAVRNLNDQEIFTQWERFTKSQTKEDASYQTKKLLRILVQKTAVK